jgi:hypothetical protein
MIAGCLGSQVIEFESGGLKYQTLTKNGLTIMVAELPSNVRGYSVVQVDVSNGSRASYVIKPEDFLFERIDGSELPAVAARSVVYSLIQKASRADVIRLVTAYENGIYGNAQYKATNGFEQRRQVALSEFTSTKVKAAAAASAIAFVQTKLLPGQSTDGAVFYANAGKPLGTGTMRVRAAGSVFEFPMLSSN